MSGSSCHFLGWCTNLRSQSSELFDELLSCNVCDIIDLNLLVDLNLGLDEFLMVGIRELELVGGAIVWNVVDKAYLIAIHSTLLEVQIIESPSWLIRRHILFEILEFSITFFLSSISWDSCTRCYKLTSRILTFRNSHNNPFHLAPWNTLHCSGGFGRKIESRVYHVFFYFFELYFIITKLDVGLLINLISIQP